jgi:hypothetical protein
MDIVMYKIVSKQTKRVIQVKGKRATFAQFAMVVHKNSRFIHFMCLSISFL